jgi:T4-like virus tail tube protein gp19.
MASTLGVEDMLPTKFQTIAKRQFILAIEGIDAFLVKSASRPTVTTEEVPINWINSTRYIAGKTTFGTMTVTLHDAIAPSGAQQVMEWLRLCFESVSGRSGWAEMYKRDIQLKLLDPVGTVIQLWDIKGAWITEANFNDVTYEGSDQTEISLTLRFDNSVLQF